MSNNTHQYSLPRGDAQDCLIAAMGAVLTAKPEEQIVAVTGRASTTDPKDEVEQLQQGERAKFVFEWKVAHMPVDKLAPRVQKWRCKASGGYFKLDLRERKYLKFLQKGGLEDLRKDRKPKLPRPPRTKGPSGEMGASEELGSSSKQPTTDSLPESESQSSLRSPNISRPPSAASSVQPAMGPPPPVHPGQAGVHIQRTTRQSRGRRGSRGSTGSATSRVGSRLAGLAVESPSEGSPEGLPPPPEGSPWGGPQGVARGDPAQFGVEYEAQVSTHGHQGPGRVHRAPAPGELTDVYGHPQYVEPGRPRGPPRVGFPLSQFTEQGDWIAPQPGQQQVPGEQTAAQRSHQLAGMEGAQSGSGYPYTPSFSSEGEGEPSLLEDAPLAESPELQDLTESEFDEAYFLSSFQNMPSLSPPTMPNIDPALFQAHTTLPPLEQNYPSSLPRASQPAFADFIYWPEPEDASADLESEWDGEDDQFSYQHPPETHPSLYPGIQDDGRTHHQASVGGGSQPAYMDPYMGANQPSEHQPAYGDPNIGPNQSGEHQIAFDPYASAYESSGEE